MSRRKLNACMMGNLYDSHALTTFYVSLFRQDGREASKKFIRVVSSVQLV